MKRPLRGLFVTGTDTGVGKTTVSMGLLRYAKRRGWAPIPFKPVETGCAPEAQDARSLWLAAQAPVHESEVCLYRLRLPAAPSQAAAAEGVSIDVELILQRAQALAAKGDFLLVEGAGGLLVPYVDAKTTVDIAAGLGLPLLVVARTALGTVNHTALTLREARRSGLDIAGLIFSQSNASPAPHETGNAHLIESLTGQSALGRLPYLAEGARTDADQLAEALRVSVGEPGLDRLLSAGL
jgi:dethiobiotin synthetase